MQTTSAFDLAFESRLRELLKPAVRFLLEKLDISFNSRIFKSLSSNFDFSYAILISLLDFPALSIANASFSEYFYGIKRQIGNGPFKQNYRYWALIALVVPPLLKSQLDRYYLELNGGEDMLRIGPEVRRERFEREQRQLLTNLKETQQQFKLQRFKMYTRWAMRKMMFQGYPTAHALAYAVLLGYRLCFIAGLTTYWSPWMHLLRSRYSRVTPFDQQVISHKHKQSRLLVAGLFSGLRTLVPVLFFLLRFVDWWYSAEAADRFQQLTHSGGDNSSKSFGIPPPPPPFIPQTSPANVDTYQCRLCKRQPCQEPAVLKQSGYIFCYECILDFLRQNGKCPVTNVTINSKHFESCVRKLFDGDSGLN